MKRIHVLAVTFLAGLICGCAVPAHAESVSTPITVKPGTYICGNTGYIAVIKHHTLKLLDEDGKVHFSAPATTEDYAIYTDFWGDINSPQVVAVMEDSNTVKLFGHQELKNLNLICSHF